jgi:hypothetical protein
MKSILSESTLIPVSLVFSLLGGAGYVTYIAVQTSANAKTLEKLEQKQATVDKMGIDIAVILSKLEAIEKKMDRHD